MRLAEAQRVLICLRFGIGDLIMQLPALQALRRALPGAHLAAVGASPALELLEGEPTVNELVDVRGFGFGHWGDVGDPASVGRVVDWLRQRGFDAVIDPSHAVLGFGAAVWQAGVALLLDSGRDKEERALSLRGNGLAAVHEATRNAWGIGLDDTVRPQVALTAQERHFARDWLQERGLATRRLYGVAPVASSSLKQWPLQAMAAVADRALSSPEAAVLLFAGDQESERDRLLAAVRHRTRIQVVPAMNLRRTAALLEPCERLLCNDTGLMHLADAVGTPTVAIFGPTSAAIYAPPGSRAVSSGRACSYRLEHRFGPPECVARGVCLNGGQSCIGDVGVQQVWDVFQTLPRLHSLPSD